MGKIVPGSKITFICIQCGNKRTRYRNPKCSNKFCSRGCYSNWIKENPDLTYFSNNSFKGERNGNYGRHPNHVKAWGDMKELSKLGRMAQSNRKPTKPEQHLYKLLKDANINFEPQKWIGVYQIDAFVPPNIAIEVDGEYWHNLPHRKKSDINKNNYLKEQNIRIIRFWSKDILKMDSLEGCIK